MFILVVVCVMPCFFRYCRFSSSCFLLASFGVMVGVWGFVFIGFMECKHVFV